MKRLLILLLFTQVISSCEEKEEIQLKKLPGNWIWTASCSGFSGLCNYPDRDNYKTIQITNDRFKLKTSGLITIDTTYEIIQMNISDPNLPYEKNYELKLGNGQILQMTLVEDKNKLFIANNLLIDNYKRQ